MTTFTIEPKSAGVIVSGVVPWATLTDIKDVLPERVRLACIEYEVRIGTAKPEREGLPEAVTYWLECGFIAYELWAVAETTLTGGYGPEYESRFDMTKGRWGDWRRKS